MTGLECGDAADLRLKNFLQTMPKVELHAHLNGSLSETTMNKLIALKQKKCCDGKMQPGLNFNCLSASSLSECFRLFSVIHEITDSPEAIKMATTDVITDFYNDGVCHLEIRSTPKEVAGTMSQRLYVQSVLAAIKECKDTFPAMSMKLILSVNRGNPVSIAEETVNLAVEYFSSGDDVVGLDLSGNPLEGNISSLIPILQYGKNAGLKLSLHMAETPNTSDEASNLLKLRPDRIGHGTYLHPSKGGSQENLSTLQQLQIPLEICLTSNIISRTIPSYSEHHFPLWRRIDYPCVLCTDDKGIFNTCLSNEYYLAEQHYSLGAENIWTLALESINYSFLDDENKKILHHSFLKEKDNVFSKLNAV